MASRTKKSEYGIRYSIQKDYEYNGWGFGKKHDDALAKMQSEIASVVVEQALSELMCFFGDNGRITIASGVGEISISIDLLEIARKEIQMWGRDHRSGCIEPEAVDEARRAIASLREAALIIERALPKGGQKA